MNTPEHYLKIASAQLWPYLEANSPGALVPPQIQRNEERARWQELTNKALELVEERRQYGADIINDMTLEAEQATAHTNLVEQNLVGLMGKVSELRRTATGSTPQCLNLAAIDRIIGALPIAWLPKPVEIKMLGEVLESWSEDNVSPDYGFENTADAAMDFLTQLGQMGYSIVATSSLPEVLRPQKPHHIPCGQCGACAANEPCSSL